MEHLPKRTGQTLSIFPEILYRCQDKYDGGPFLEYPQRVGLPRLEDDGTFRLDATLSISNKRSLAAVPQAKLEAFLQSWLFFGLLHVVLGDLYRHDDFVATYQDGNVEKTIITTAGLLPRLGEWEAKITQDIGALTAIYEHTAQCLRLAYACLVIKYPAFDSDLRFHLASVAELLSYAANKACNVAWTDSRRRSLVPIIWGKTISDDFRMSLLLERSNCCPSQMEMLNWDFKSPQALAFVATCFNEDSAPLSHASCDGNTCRAGCSMTSRQLTRHVSESCRCEFLHVDENQLTDCLEKGSLPLLQVKKEANDEVLSIEIVASTESTPYVALSHVWADGLGNPTATALPRCQISRLKSMADNLDFEYLDDPPEDAPEMLLWCDTLCCPVESSEGKSMALKQMYRTYDQASVVLVLDRSLLSGRIGGMGIDEACLRVATSRWMTRLWTLQEAALPTRNHVLWFQFTKTALPARSLLRNIVNIQKTDIGRRGVVDSVLGRFLTFTNFFDNQGGEKQGAQLEDIMTGLKYRSVTVPSDEPLIVATLLALDISQILASDPAQRMNVLWRMIGTSSSGITTHILFHMGPKMHERGLRWAPQSLLSMDTQFAIPNSHDEDDRGILAADGNSEGLLVKLAGFRISLAEPNKGLPSNLVGFDSLPRNDIRRHRLLLRDSQGDWYILTHRLTSTSDTPPILEEMRDVISVISGLTRPWVLYRGTSSTIPANTEGHLGLLVEEAKEQHSQSDVGTCVAIISQVSFSHVPAGVNQMFQAAYCLTQELVASAAARRLEDLDTVSTDLDDALYREAFCEVGLELQRLARSPFAMEALVASGDGADERGITSIEKDIERFYQSKYLQIEEYAPGSRKWCVD